MSGKDRVSSVVIMDPSDKFRPERKEELFRNYTQDNEYHNRVKRNYYMMHTNQTKKFAQEKLDYWLNLNHAELTIMEALDFLNTLIDESDPDVNVPNSVHAYQTAERIRQCHPDKEWFQLIGLIHDVGKVMAVWGEPQWCVVGDTYPLGCAFSNEIVFGHESFKDCSDWGQEVYSQKNGVYEENCGLEKVTMSWGHDEYLYHVLKKNTCFLPEEAFYIIRFHSFYPWHTCGAYMHLCDNKDLQMLKWVQEFNKFDLYSKADHIPDVTSLKSYYQTLIDKYIPGKLKW